MDKKDILILIVTIIIVVILVAEFTNKGILRAKDCYDFHVQECLDCHSQNLGFAVCSGFCYNSTSDSPCFIGMEKNCETSISHGCNLNYPPIVCVPFTDICSGSVKL